MDDLKKQFGALSSETAQPSETSQPSEGGFSDIKDQLDTIQNGDQPADIKSAKKDLGHQDYNNLCQAFVEKATGSGWQGTSAYDAWTNQQDRSSTDLKNMKKGDLIYFSPTSDNEAGHTGIYMGGNDFISATPDGVAVKDISQWMNQTGQSILGYIPKSQEGKN